MKISLNFLFLVLLLLVAACARIADGKPADASKDPTTPKPQASPSPDMRAEVSKLFASLTNVDDASPEALERTLGIRFSPAQEIPGSVRWEGTSACGARFIRVIPDDSPPGQSVLITMPMHSAPNGEPTCCLLKVADLSADLSKLGYTKHLTDVLDRKHLWIFQASPRGSDANISARVYTLPESRSVTDTAVCVDGIDIGVGTREERTLSRH